MNNYTIPKHYKKTLNMTPDVEEFLKVILLPDTVDIDTVLSVHISNLVKAEVWSKIQYAKLNGYY